MQVNRPLPTHVGRSVGSVLMGDRGMMGHGLMLMLIRICDARCATTDRRLASLCCFSSIQLNFRPLDSSTDRQTKRPKQHIIGGSNRELRSRFLVLLFRQRRQATLLAYLCVPSADLFYLLPDLIETDDLLCGGFILQLQVACFAPDR